METQYGILSWGFLPQTHVWHVDLVRTQRQHFHAITIETRENTISLHVFQWLIGELR